MKPNTSQFKTKLIIFFVIIFSISIYIFTYVIANKGSSAFTEPSGVQSISSSTSIEALIVQGAGFYLTGNSEFLVFLNRVETAPNPAVVDYNELNAILNRSISAMESCLETYSALETRANSTPYNPSFIEILRQFDYQGFRNERNLSGAVIDGLENLLVEGNVRGVFSRLKLDTETLLEGLRTLKSSVEVFRFPENKDFWRLNQKFSETMLFGQFAAEIFYEVSSE